MEMITKDYIYLDTDYNSRAELLNSIANKLLSDKRIHDIDQFINDITAREEQISTYLGNGIAIPHCKTNNIMNSTVIIIRNKSMIDWNNEKEKTNLFFLLCVIDSNQNNSHLKILARLAQNIMDEKFLNIIKNEQDKDLIYEVLKKIEK